MSLSKTLYLDSLTKLDFVDTSQGFSYLSEVGARGLLIWKKSIWTIKVEKT